MLFRYFIKFYVLTFLLGVIFPNVITPAEKTPLWPESPQEAALLRLPTEDKAPFIRKRKKIAHGDDFSIANGLSSLAISEPAACRMNYTSPQARASLIEITPLKIDGRSLQEIRYSMIKNILRHGTKTHPLTRLIATLFSCIAEVGIDGEDIWRVFLHAPTSDDLEDLKDSRISPYHSAAQQPTSLSPTSDLIRNPKKSVKSSASAHTPSKHASSWAQELNYFFWNFDDECIAFLRTGTTSTKQTCYENRVDTCFRAIEKKVKVRLKTKGLLTIQETLLGASFDSSSSSSRGKEFTPGVKLFIKAFLTALQQCMKLDTDMPPLNTYPYPFFQTTGGPFEKLALLLFNFYRYSLSRTRNGSTPIPLEYCAPAGINYADSVPPCDTPEINDIFLYASRFLDAQRHSSHIDPQEFSLNIYLTLVQTTGLYEAIHFPFNVLESVVSLPRHIVKMFLDLQSMHEPISTTCSSSDQSSSICLLGTVLDSSFLQRPPQQMIPHVATIKRMLDRFDDYINELLASFVLNQPSEKNISLSTLQNTFFEILRLKQQGLLCHDETNVCPFDLGTFVIAAKRIQAAFKTFSINCLSNGYEYPQEVDQIIQSKDFDNTCLVRDQHINQLVYEIPLLSYANPTLMGGHIATSLPYTIPCTLNVDDDSLNDRYRVDTLQLLYTSPQSGCSTGVWHITDKATNQASTKHKTIFPHCYSSAKHSLSHLQKYLHLLMHTPTSGSYNHASSIKIAHSPDFTPIEINLCGRMFRGTKYLLIAKHTHKYGCRDHSCTKNAPLRVALPFLVLELPEGGIITIMLTAYPTGTDCYSSMQETPEYPIIIPYDTTRTETGSPIIDAAASSIAIAQQEMPIDLQSSYQALRTQIIAYILGEQADQSIIENIRRNILITAENDEFCSWNYLDPSKTIVGEVTMLRIQDTLVLKALIDAYTSSPPPTQELLGQLQAILDSANRDNPSAFIIALCLDFTETFRSLSPSLSSSTTPNIGRMLIDFLRRNQMRAKQLMELLKSLSKLKQNIPAVASAEQPSAAFSTPTKNKKKL